MARDFGISNQPRNALPSDRVTALKPDISVLTSLLFAIVRKMTLIVFLELVAVKILYTFNPAKSCAAKVLPFLTKKTL